MNGGGMNSVQQFTFMGTPLSVLVSLLVVAVTAALGYFAWRRSGYSKSVAGLELLRVAIVALVAALLNQPEWVQEYPPESKPTIAVLWDQSDSMQTIDVVTSDSSAAVSRAEAIEPLTHAAAWQRLDERLKGWRPGIVDNRVTGGAIGQYDHCIIGAGVAINADTIECPINCHF